MDDDPRKRSIKELGFESWLTNVFWAYYKWYFFLGVFAVTFLVLTVITYARQDRADMRLTYVYAGTADADQAETARSRVASLAKPEGGRGAVRVKVDAVPLVDEKGERRTYGELEDSDRILYLLDRESLDFYQALGYFAGARQLPGLDLWVGLNDAPVTLYRLEDFADQGYKQEQIDDSNAYLIQHHGEQVQAARELVESLAQG
jgi:hypothetical protein